MKNEFAFGTGRGVPMWGGLAMALAAPFAQAADTPSAALTGGKVSLDVRYRYEHVSQGNALKEADASTVRSRLGYTTDTYRGLGAMLEFENISLVGDEHYNSGGNGKTQYSVVTDPKGTEVNQAYLSFGGLPATSVKFGRQRIVLDNQRFIGNVGWRQNEQTFDALSFVNKSLRKTTLTYAHISNVNRIAGTDADMSSDILNIKYDGWAAGSLSAYVYLIDYATGAAQSTATHGLRFSGGTPANDAVKLLYSAEYARQSDYADNPANYGLDYYLAEFGGSARGITAKLGYEVLEGNGTQSVQTPLATLHAFNGWADQFLTTPTAGLEDTYVSVGGTWMQVDLLAIYHDYRANRGSADYGSELNLQVTKNFNKTYTLAAKYASYSAGDLAGKVDTDKFWLVAQLAF